MSEANWYADTFKAWPVKLVGSKPTADMLAAIHKLGARPGKQALACAMALRPEGVTGSQIQIVCSAPQLNKMRGFITDGLLKRMPVSPSSLGHTVYKLEVTGKGKQRIERVEKANAKADEATQATADKPAAKPAKAKGAVKAKRAPKAKPVETPISEPAIEPVTDNQPQA